jgi:predicted HicB family RNase H-like nuclease
MKRESEKASKRGRPEKPEGEKLKALPVRCKDSERKAYEKAATRAGVSLAEWIRATLNEAAQK